MDKWPLLMSVYGLVFNLIFFLHFYSYFKVVFTNPGNPPLTPLISPGVFEQQSNVAQDISIEMAVLTRTREDSPHKRQHHGHSESLNMETSTSQYHNNQWKMITAKRNGEQRSCTKCGILKPDRSHHCSICEACILKMDHHCPW